MKSRKTREFYLSLLGVVGEIPSLKAATLAPAAPATAGDELRLMMKCGLIRYHRHGDRVRTFMISDPAGFEAIGEIDPRLLQHAEMIVGKKGARYRGSKEYRLKKRKEAILMYSMLERGIVVDGARFDENKKMCIQTPDMTSAEEIIKNAEENEPLFLSGLLLKHKKAAVSLTRREMSTSTGALFSKGGLYITYSIGTARYRWYQAAELSAVGEITRLYEDAKQVGRRGDGRYRAIIYTDTVSVASDLIETTGSGKQKMDPISIYRLTYLVPMEDRSHAMDITKMLTIPDWRTKSDSVLGLKPGGKHDGKTDDDRNIYNLLCCNLAKLHEVSGEIRRGKCKLVIHDWQRPVLEKLFEAEVDAIALTTKQFKGLLAEVSEMKE